MTKRRRRGPRALLPCAMLLAALSAGSAPAPADPGSIPPGHTLALQPPIARSEPSRVPGLVPLAPAPEDGPPAAADGLTWEELPPPARADHAAVLDARRNRLVIFGGRVNRDHYRNDVWILSLADERWERADPLGEPPSPRAGCSAILDAPRDRMLVFGGVDASGCRNDLWELSLNGRPRWRLLTPAGAPPPGRERHTLTLDPEHDRAFVFAGSDGHYRGDLWQLALAGTPAWSQVTDAGTAPPPRAGHTAVYAPDQHGIIVFAGAGEFICPGVDDPCYERNDTWFLSTRGAPRWTDLTPRLGAHAPCAAQGHGAVYDTSGKRMLVFAGGSYTRGCLGAHQVTWALSLRDSAWSQITPAPAQAPWLARAVAVMDPAGDRIILQGGERSLGYVPPQIYSFTWTLSLADPAEWKRIGPQDWDGGGTAPGMIYEPIGDRLVLHTGWSVWTYSFGPHSGWEALSPSGTAPPQRLHHSVAFDSARRRLLVFGGQAWSGGSSWYASDAWALSLDEHPAWAPLAPDGRIPGRFDAGTIYDPIRDRLVVMGGLAFSIRSDAWALALGDSSGWTQLTPQGVSQVGRGAAAVIRDPVRDRAVMFGGGLPGSDAGSYNDVWALSLSGTSRWSQLLPFIYPPAAPERRVFPCAGYDPAGDRMIVLGGYNPWPFMSGPFLDLWALDLATPSWARLDAAGGPVPDWTAPVAAYDSKRGRLLVFEQGALWALNLGVRERGRGAARPMTSAPIAGAAAAFALRSLTPTGEAGAFVAEVTLPDAAPARLELLDVAGRRVGSQELAGLGAGAHRVTLIGSEHVPPGLYLMRLARGGTALTAKVVRLR